MEHLLYIEISWDAVLGATSYTIYRSADESGPYEEVGTSVTSPYLDTETDVIWCGFFWYKVAACGESGCGQLSLPDEGCRSYQPDMPTGLSASDGTYSDKVVVTWDDPGDPEIMWKVYRASYPGGSTVRQGNAYSPTWTDTTAVPGQTYWYRVQADRLSCRSGLGPEEPGYREP